MRRGVLNKPVKRVRLERIALRYAEEFLAAARRSRGLHGRFVSAPLTLEDFRNYVRAKQRAPNLGYCVIGEHEQLVGVINLNEIVHGMLQSAF
jgi:ribosomal-protein-alanine N-acetyltransferase